MIPKLGAQGAADLQRRMTDHLIANLKAIIDLNALSVEVRFEGGSLNHMQNWLGASFSYRPQGNGDLGCRMETALADAFGQGHESVVIIGSDIPDITSDIVQEAFEKLQTTDLVLGPAADGGYYLIGLNMSAMQQSHGQLFENIAWGTEKVLSQTLENATRIGLSHALLVTLKDVDRPDDLVVWDRASRIGMRGDGNLSISIIIPTLNEAGDIGQTLARIPRSEKVEILVVDGGSSDNTVEIAKTSGARVLTAAPSKAGQMNAGAAEAAGDVFLFLHADTWLPPNFAAKVRAAVSRQKNQAGAFTLGINSAARRIKFIEYMANRRARLFKLPYGDQALFVHRDMFFEIGGFPEYPIMEDFEFVRRLKKKTKITILPESVETSPRRWHNFGVIKTWLVNQIILGAYFIGISPHRLAFWYRRDKGKRYKKKD